MQTKCGIDFDNKLIKKSPSERFEYIRLFLIKKLKQQNIDTEYLQKSNIRKKLNIKSKLFKDLLYGNSIDYNFFLELSKIINEDISVLISGHENRLINKPIKNKVDDKLAKKIINRSKKHGFELYIVNNCPIHLSLKIDKNKIFIYENNDAPSDATVVLISRQDYYVGSKIKNKTFPEKIII